MSQTGCISLLSTLTLFGLFFVVVNLQKNCIQPTSFLNSKEASGWHLFVVHCHPPCFFSNFFLILIFFFTATRPVLDQNFILDAIVSVSESVSGSLLVSDFGDSYRICRACELVICQFWKELHHCPPHKPNPECFDQMHVFIELEQCFWLSGCLCCLPGSPPIPILPPPLPRRVLLEVGGIPLSSCVASLCVKYLISKYSQIFDIKMLSDIWYQNVVRYLISEFLFLTGRYRGVFLFIQYYFL